jgi:hypothetical protein
MTTSYAMSPHELRTAPDGWSGDLGLENNRLRVGKGNRVQPYLELVEVVCQFSDSDSVCQSRRDEK